MYICFSSGVIFNLCGLHTVEQYFVEHIVPHVTHIFICLIRLGAAELLCVAAQELEQNLGLVVTLSHIAHLCFNLILLASDEHCIEQNF